MNSSLKDTLFCLVKELFTIDCYQLDEQSDIYEQLSLDSIQYLQLISQIEKKFSIELPLSLLEVSTIKEFVERLDFYLSKK